MLSNWDHSQLRMALLGYVGPVCELFWSYLSLCLGRDLNDAERAEIARTYLGHR